MLRQINTTTVTLIPKMVCPNSVKDFRPISCSNVLYRVISKIICNRLKKVLPHLINPAQAGFLEGRTILQNVILCQDLVKHGSRKRGKPKVILKVDILKAYDSIS